MSVIRAVTTGLLAAVALVGCSSLQPGEPLTTSPASGNQGFLRTQLEQALFNEIVVRFSAAHPGPLEPKDYQNLLTELEQTVALTEISSLQQQTLNALRKSAQPHPPEEPAPGLAAWVAQELAALRRIRASLGTTDPELFQTVGPTRAARQQFLGLIEASI